MKFTKMHGLGNDFIVINGITQKVSLTPALINTLSDRHRGIGFDQCLLLEAPTTDTVDFNYRIYNADGQEVGQCGNGARCLALFAQQQGLTTKTSFIVRTATTEMVLQINKDNTVTVSMGIPQFQPERIPFIAEKQAKTYHLEDQNKTSIHALSVGNPHAVLIVDNVLNASVEALGSYISHHPRFPEQTNVGFMQILGPRHIKLRVYERCCGETQACGSGAVAAAAVGRLYHGLEEQIKVSLLGGDLIVDWIDINGPISLTGPAHFIYEGYITL